MGKQGCDTGFYDSCTDYLQAALDRATSELNENLDMSHYYGYVASPTNISRELKMAKFTHDNYLDKHGQRTAIHRTHQIPFDKKMQKKKKYKKLKAMGQVEDADSKKWIMGRKTYFDKADIAEKNSNYAKEFKNIVEEQKDLLCRGKELRHTNITSKLKCFWGHNDSPWLRMAPFKVEENSHDPYHVTVHELLFDHECDKVTEFLGPLLDFPPGRMNFRTARNDWTMKK